MELYVIFIVIPIYAILALILVLYVRKKTDRKSYRWLAVALVLLLPTWDVVLGLLVYYPGCLVVPKMAVYETAVADGLYYEGNVKDYRCKLSSGSVVVHLSDYDLRRGYKYMESLVTRECSNVLYTEFRTIGPIIYRCTPLPVNPKNPDYIPQNCKPVAASESKFLVKMKEVRLGITEIRSVSITDRSNYKLMGEYNEIARKPFLIPFFLWCDWGEQGSASISRPAVSHFLDFQYTVLKPEN